MYSDTYNKDDYRKLIEECNNTYADYYCDMEVYKLNPNFDCEKVSEFGKFLVENGIFVDIKAFEDYCYHHCQMIKITNMWQMMDLLFQMKGVDEVGLLCDYADLHRDFAEASYKKCKEDVDAWNEIYS